VSSEPAASETNVIVVGVDHSAGAVEALRFALGEAKLRGTPMRAVHAWQFGYIGVTGMEGRLPGIGDELHNFRDAATAALDATLREVIPDPDGVHVERRVVEGTPAAVLVEESRDAALLVVGSRGHGGFTSLLLGSVSQQCAHHAECPVVIVRQKADTN
jgi:nucleotide-binding universal stress UspA family protein